MDIKDGLDKARRPASPSTSFYASYQTSEYTRADKDDGVGKRDGAKREKKDKNDRMNKDDKGDNGDGEKRDKRSDRYDRNDIHEGYGKDDGKKGATVYSYERTDGFNDQFTSDQTQGAGLISLPLNFKSYQSPNGPPPMPQQFTLTQTQAQPLASQTYSVPPSMVDLPPQPTQSTAGSVVGGDRSYPGIASSYDMASAYSTPYAPTQAPVYPPKPVPAPSMSAAGSLAQSPGPLFSQAQHAQTSYDGLYRNDNDLTMATAPSKTDLTASRILVQNGLLRLIDLQRQQRQHLQYGPGAAAVPNSTAAAVQEQLRLQSGAVVRDLRRVRRGVNALAKAAEAHRFRRWLIGGLLSVFVPLVRRLFRRPARSSAANTTEYAFARSRALVERMLAPVTRRRGLASVAFFVFAVLYVFSNEVSLRVARTIGRRLKKLSGKIERGDEPLDDADVKLLGGWRWRVLLWGN